MRLLSPERFEAERGRVGGARRGAAARPATGRSGSGATACAGSATLYRAAAADLAFARRRFPGDPLVARLEALVLRARAAVYARSGRRASLWRFFARGYWRRLAERPLLILLAAWLLLLVPALAGAAWGAADPAAAAGLIPAQFQAAADPPAAGRDYDPATAAAFSSSVMTNNIQVTLVAFAGGIAFGVLDGLRAVLQRADAGGDRRAGGRRGQRDRVPAAGLLARAAGDLLHRGRRDRRAADGLGADPARAAAARRRRCGARRRPAVEIAAGTVPWLVMCGLCEGFLTGPELPVAVQVTIGAALFVPVLGARVLARPSQHRARLGPQVGGDDRRGQPVRRRLEHARAGGADPRGRPGTRAGARRRRRSRGPGRAGRLRAPAQAPRLRRRPKTIR